ncbi:hypothetical protein B0G76_0853 [Paraburkholderia sp. BL23I1N1]|uniref:hypothetical protein n=1 Tax=Paraburkholderia sp. BL23I1N1 TaxID=1938802 RepID=UPI000FF4B2E8|nr:hypothetical protein [Paraburkholderia sp. BL23I1N1]RKE34826.1 hypothetical protein B0G76_0853 [Paraburkholderia sp. BL23I1N1]
MKTTYAPAAKRLPSRKHLRRTLMAWAILGLTSVAAHAQTPPALVDVQSLIGNGAAAGAVGVVAINETAGLDNAQANQGVFTNGQVPLNLIGSSQSANTNAKTTAAKSTISSNAFSNTSGLIEVNQSAGVGNLQRNSAVVGSGSIGAEIVADGVLSATTAKGGGLGRSGDSHNAREVSIGADAFKNVNGIVQINQTAGSGNVSSNSFVLRPPAGTFF